MRSTINETVIFELRLFLIGLALRLLALSVLGMLGYLIALVRFGCPIFLIFFELNFLFPLILL